MSVGRYGLRSKAHICRDQPAYAKTSVEKIGGAPIARKITAAIAAGFAHCSRSGRVHAANSIVAQPAQAASSVVRNDQTKNVSVLNRQSGNQPSADR